MMLHESQDSGDPGVRLGVGSYAIAPRLPILFMVLAATAIPIEWRYPSGSSVSWDVYLGGRYRKYRGLYAGRRGSSRHRFIPRYRDSRIHVRRC